MTPSKQAPMSNLKLDVVLLVYKCDLAFVFVMSSCERINASGLEGGQ
jgi:hypothetical protein